MQQGGTGAPGMYMDLNGNPILGFVPQTLAKNYFTMYNAPTSGWPILAASGTDANVNMQFSPKGTGILILPVASKVKMAGAGGVGECLQSAAGDMLVFGSCSTGGGSGTVTSVGLAAPSDLLTVSGSPVTTTGTLTLSKVTVAANLVYASPNGVLGLPSFRNIKPDDVTVGDKTGSSLFVMQSDATLNSPIIKNGANLNSWSKWLYTTADAGANAVNYVSLGNANTGVAPAVMAGGSDTDIHLQLRGKGTGVVDLGAASKVKITGSGGAGECLKSAAGDVLAFGACATGSGDVSSNTSTSVDGEVALFSGTGGKTIKRATGTGVAKLTSGVLSAAAVNLASEVTGTLGFGSGGTGLTAATEDSLMVGAGGSGWQAKTLPDCDDSGGNHLNYDTTNNAFSCGTSTSGGGGSVSGPGSSTVGYVPTWANTSGTSLAAGLAVASTSATASALVQRDSNGAALVYDSGAQMINCKAHGATGNGSTDDLSALNSCKASCPTNGGCTLYLPRGTYKISGTFTLGNGSPNTSGNGAASTVNQIRLLGEGPQQQNIYTSSLGTTIRYAGSSGTGPAIKVAGPIAGVQIENIDIDGDNLANVGLEDFHCFGCRFQNVAVRKFRATGILMHGDTGDLPTNVGVCAGQTRYDHIYVQQPTSSLSNQIGVQVGGDTMDDNTAVGGSDCGYSRGLFQSFEIDMNAGSGTGLLLRALDASEFDNIYVAGGQYGVYAKKPTGTSTYAGHFPQSVVFGHIYTAQGINVTEAPGLASSGQRGLNVYGYNSEAGAAPAGSYKVRGLSTFGEIFGEWGNCATSSCINFSLQASAGDVVWTRYIARWVDGSQNEQSAVMADWQRVDNDLLLKVLGTNTMRFGQGGIVNGIRFLDGTRPTCSSSIRGTYWHAYSGSGVGDKLQVCAKDTGEAYSWRDIWTVP